MAAGRPKAVTDDELIEALTKARGFISVAANMVGLKAETIRKRIADSVELKAAMYDIKESNLDAVEMTLMKLIQKEDFNATKLYLETHGKDRGYGRQREDVGQYERTIVILPERQVIDTAFTDVDTVLKRLEAKTNGGQ